MLRQLYLIFLLFCLTFTLTWAEDSGKKVKGRVCDENKQPIIGANVYWEGTQNGTTSDVDGNFELERKGDSKNLASPPVCNRSTRTSRLTTVLSPRQIQTHVRSPSSKSATAGTATCAAPEGRHTMVTIVFIPGDGSGRKSAGTPSRSV